MAIIDQVGYVAESCRQNGGKRTVVHSVFRAGAEAPAHYHTDFEETLEVTKGELMVWLRGRKRRLAPGDRITIPRGAKHRYENRSQDEVAAIVTLEPGHLGYEQNIQILRGLQREGKLEALDRATPDVIPTALVLTRLSNVKLTGVTLLLHNILRRLHREKLDAEQARLLARYR